MKVARTDKAFFLLLAIVSFFTAFWIYHTHTVLYNNDAPLTVVHLFDLNNDLLYNIITIFSIILLLLSNIFYWRNGKRIFFLWSVLYFMAGIISRAVLEDARFYYTSQNGLLKGKLSSGFEVTVYLIVIVIAITIIDFFIIAFIRKRTLKMKRKL